MKVLKIAKTFVKTKIIRRLCATRPRRLFLSLRCLKTKTLLFQFCHGPLGVTLYFLCVKFYGSDHRCDYMFISFGVCVLQFG